jgi:uncharacterized protein YgfB (UPF0149 family)
VDSSFDEVIEILERAGANISPAELQGFLCGHLCSGNRDHNSWLRHATVLLDIGELKPELKNFLISLFDKDEACIKESDFEFELLLPDDDEELSIRVLCVGQWCQGFLTSFGLGCDDERARALSEEAQGTLSDFVAISQISGDVDEDNVAEGAYTEITEYIRMAVLSVAMECREPPTEQSSNSAVH